MKLLSTIRSLVHTVLHRNQMETEMDDELRFHLEARADDLMSRAGISREEALRRARIEFGGVDKYKEQGRQARGLQWIEEARGDLIYAMRQLRAAPTFTLITTLTLALGIGANTAAFTRINEALFKSLPVSHPEQLRQLQWAAERHSFRTMGNTYGIRTEGYDISFSYTAYQYLRQRSTSFTDMLCADGPQNVNLGIQGVAEIATAVPVSGNYFQVLGIDAVLGRTIVPDDERPGASPVVVLSYAYWQRVFGGDRAVIGRTVTVNGTPAVIVGIAPRSFSAAMPSWQPDVMLSLSIMPTLNPTRQLSNPRWWTFIVVGRLKPGIPDEQARAEIETLLNQAILADAPETAYDPPRVAMASGGSGFYSATPELLIPFGASALVLLIGCANIAGLLLSRSVARRREIGTRLALGAARGRLIRQLVTESLILSIVGGVLGVTFAFWASDSAGEPDLRVLTFSVSISVFTGIVFGLAPAFRATRVDLLTMLKQSDVRTFSDRSLFRTGKALVSVQVALSLLLVIGAGLFIQTVSRLRSQDMGFQTDQLLTFRTNPYLNGYREERLITFYEEALKKVRSLPGVRAASASRWGILGRSSSGDRIRIPGQNPASVSTHYIATDYLEAMGIPLLLGRTIEERDARGASRVAVVDEAFVKRFYSGQNPVGQKFTMDSPKEVEIVGVVGDTKYFDIRAAAGPTVYLSYRQENERWMTFGVRTAGDPSTVVPLIRRAIAEIDSNLPIYDVHTQKEWIDLNLTREREIAGLLSFFGAVALLLASMGIYGTLSYAVSHRTSEIGIRMALGAERVKVMQLVVAETLAPVAVGLGVGLAAAAAVTQALQTVLFGISPTDPRTIVIAALFLFLAAALAAYIPARRASRIDPMIALRYE